MAKPSAPVLYSVNPHMTVTYVCIPPCNSCSTIIDGLFCRSVRLIFTVPSSNGGKTISRYWLEYSPIGMNVWKRIQANAADINNNPIAAPNNPNEAHLLVPSRNSNKIITSLNLYDMPVGYYDFRIVAQNADGFSPPSNALNCLVTIGPYPDPQIISVYSDINYTKVASIAKTAYINIQPALTSGINGLTCIPRSKYTEDGSTIYYSVSYRKVRTTKWTTATNSPKILRANPTIPGLLSTNDPNVFRVANLNSSFQYEFRVYALNALSTGGFDKYTSYGAFAAPIVAESPIKPPAPTPLPVPVQSKPNAPVLSLNSVVGKTINLTWTKPNSNNSSITKYILEYMSGSSFANWHAPLLANSIDNISPELLQIPVTLVYSGQYVFRIRAVNSVGISDYSNEVTATIS